jgi:PTS system cellobiose-specific IIC component
MVAGLGGTGSTLGLALDTFTAKSEKYKTMNKLVVIPNIFNINEPIIFGFPIIMNPIYFLPMVLSSLVNGFVGLLLLKIIPVNINPTIQTPWVTPTVISALLQGGLGYFVIVLACLLADMLLYLPFFKIDDARALKEEQASQAQEAEIANPELVKAA